MKLDTKRNVIMTDRGLTYRYSVPVSVKVKENQYFLVKIKGDWQFVFERDLESLSATSEHLEATVCLEEQLGKLIFKDGWYFEAFLEGTPGGTKRAAINCSEVRFADQDIDMTSFYRTSDKKLSYHGNELLGVDEDTFVLLSANHAADKNHVYFGEKVLVGADPKTFVAFDHSHGKDNKNVYYFSAVLKKADAQTFEPMQDFSFEGLRYFRDKDHIFCDERIIRHIDRDSFEFLDGRVAKDNNQVLLLGDPIKGADPLTFQKMHGQYYSDKNFIYSCGIVSSGVLAPNTGNFKPLSSYYFINDNNLYFESVNGLLAENVAAEPVLLSEELIFYGHQVYYLGAPIGNKANLDQVELIGGDYICIASQIYFKDEEVIGADISTFAVFDEDIAHDKNSMYYGSDVIPKSVGKSVNRINVNYYFDENSVYLFDHRQGYYDVIRGLDTSKLQLFEEHYITDGSKVFYYTSEIPDVDVASLEVLEGNYRKDKNFVYFGHKKLSLSPKSVQVVEFVYAHDDQSVYYYGEPLELDGSRFTLIDGRYSRDDKKVFFEEEPVEGADSASFKILNGDYAVDKKSTYFKGYNLGVDPGDIRKVQDGYLIDSHSVYLGSVKLEGVDVNNFEILEYGFARDDKRVLYLTYNLSAKECERRDCDPLDAASFEVLSYSEFSDCRGIYTFKAGQIVMKERMGG